jgi:hypothetical protein
MKAKEWTTAASERCRRAKERQEREAEAARERELAALRAQARQKPPNENAVDCTPYLDDADIVGNVEVICAMRSCNKTVCRTESRDEET